MSEDDKDEEAKEKKAKVELELTNEEFKYLDKLIAEKIVWPIARNIRSKFHKGVIHE